MDISELKPIIEAMIFVSEEPLTESGILIALADDGVDKEQVRACLASIEKEWNETSERGIQISHVAGGYQFRTKENCAEWLRRLNVPKPMRLSAPALETLAIVAYKQPIVRSEIEKIRGVDSGAVLKTLLERRLLRIVGRRDEPGQPLLYGTTKEFLEIFNLKTLKELPTLKDIEDLLRERRTGTDSRPVEIVDGELGAAPEGDEGSAEVIEGDDEEDTEVIRRYPLDEDEEEERKDMEALSSLEDNLKDLRRIEKKIFPNPIAEVGGIGSGGDDAGQRIQGGLEAAPEPGQGEETGEGPATAVYGASNEDAPAADDRPVE